MTGKQTPETVGARLKGVMGQGCTGLGHCVREERSFRIKTLVACAFLPMALIVDVTMLQHVMLVLSILMVLIVELLHVAIGHIADQVPFERSDQRQEIRCITAAAVLITAIFAGFAWISILFLWK